MTGAEQDFVILASTAIATFFVGAPFVMPRRRRRR